MSFRDSGRTRATSLGRTAAPTISSACTEEPAMRLRKSPFTSSEASPLSPIRRKLNADTAQRPISGFEAMPWRHASTPRGKAEAPEIRVRSRSKNAAELAMPSGYAHLGPRQLARFVEELGEPIQIGRRAR